MVNRNLVSILPFSEPIVKLKLIGHFHGPDSRTKAERQQENEEVLLHKLFHHPGSSILLTELLDLQ